MPDTMTATLQIMDVLARSSSNGCLWEDLGLDCPELTWN